MNALERILQDDLDRLVDRLAATTNEGMMGGWSERRPELLARLEAAEGHVSSLRGQLLEGYSAWRDALEQCGDLWSLAHLAAERPSAPERPSLPERPLLPERQSVSERQAA